MNDYVTGALLGGSLILTSLYSMRQPIVSSENLGRDIYIAEGCIHCHSQYSRPRSIDTSMYGPASPDVLPHGEPVLIGNRRQGPDLANIGLRRSREWNRIHLIDPQAVSPSSTMPSYGHLFSNDASKGDALLDYLASLKSERQIDWWNQLYAWSPSESLKGNPIDGGALYAKNCAQCHGDSGYGDGPLASAFSSRPRNLNSSPYHFAPQTLEPALRHKRLAQIIKYGQPGASMPGHEYLTDQQIVDLVSLLLLPKTNPRS
jgi:mono/diheme cytochrome c family protein